jgi:branched-chain amino acid transport system permease protein
MRLVNLSHGDWLIVAAYLCGLTDAGAGVAVLGLAGGGARDVRIGLLWFSAALLNHVSVQAAERRGMSPVFGLMLPLLVTFGLSIVLSQGMLLIFSADAVTIKNDLSFSAIRLSEDLSVSTLRLGFFVAAAALIGLLAAWMRLTHTGRAYAASDDAEMATLMGMRTPHLRRGQRCGVGRHRPRSPVS